MVIQLVAVTIVIVVVGFVLYCHWTERFGDNHF